MMMMMMMMTPEFGLSPNEKERLHFVVDLPSQSEFTTHRKTESESEMTDYLRGRRRACDRHDVCRTTAAVLPVGSRFSLCFETFTMDQQ